MGRYVYEELTRVVWVPGEDGIADITAPTESELNDAGNTYLSDYLKKDGISTPQNQNNVDSATLDDSFDAQEVGSWGGQLELTFYRDDSDDKAWDLWVRRTRGFIVVRRGIEATEEFADGEAVEVYPVSMHQPIPQPSAANEMQTFSGMCAVRSPGPELKAVVGGGS